MVRVTSPAFVPKPPVARQEPYSNRADASEPAPLVGIALLSSFCDGFCHVTLTVDADAMPATHTAVITNNASASVCPPASRLRNGLPTNFFAFTLISPLGA